MVKERCLAVKQRVLQIGPFGGTQNGVLSRNHVALIMTGMERMMTCPREYLKHMKKNLGQREGEWMMLFDFGLWNQRTYLIKRWDKKFPNTAGCRGALASARLLARRVLYCFLYLLQ